MKWVFKKILFPGESRGQSQNRKAFTLIEVTVALIVFGMIAATVLVVINKAIETVVMWQTKMQAFEIARENMEKILAQSSVTDFVEYGMSETNPDISWETTISSFYEPLTNQMWMRAVCTAQFVDSEGEEQKIELMHWLTSLNKDQILQILEQKQREDAYQASLGGAAGEPGLDGQQTSQLQQRANQLQEKAEQMQEQAEQMQEQAKQMQEAKPQEAEKLQQEAEKLQQQADKLQQQAEKLQQQAEQEPQNQQDSEAESWKEIENLIGPPPQGYDNWGQVPEEQFWEAVMKWFGKK